MHRLYSQCCSVWKDNVEENQKCHVVGCFSINKTQFLITRQRHTAVEFWQLYLSLQRGREVTTTLLPTQLRRDSSFLQLLMSAPHLGWNHKCVTFPNLVSTEPVFYSVTFLKCVVVLGPASCSVSRHKTQSAQTASSKFKQVKTMINRISLHLWFVRFGHWHVHENCLNLNINISVFKKFQLHH